MFRNKIIILLSILIIVIPSFAKKKKIDISTLMRDRKADKEELTTTSIMKRDRTLAINYIKVRNRIYLAKKRRKFKLIFKASIKHILEKEEREIIKKPVIGSSVLELHHTGSGSSFSITPLTYKNRGFNSEIGVINSGYNRLKETILFFNGNIKTGRLNFDFGLGKDINKTGGEFFNTQLLFKWVKGLKTRLSLSNGEKPLSPEYGLTKREEYNQNELFETFSLIKKIDNYELKILQNHSKIGTDSFNLYELSFIKNDDDFTGFLSGGYLFDSKYVKNNSLYLKMGVMKKIGVSKIGVEYPFLFNCENNPVYFRRLYYRFIPKIMLNTYLPFLESEIFLDLYINKDRVLYVWGIRKFSL